MNRSARRVIGATIAAGVLCTGPGAAPAAADPPPDNTENTVASPPADGRPTPRPPRGATGAGVQVSVGNRRPPPCRWRCPLPWWWFGNWHNNNFLPVQPAFVAPVVPVAQVSGGVKPAQPGTGLPFVDLPNTATLETAPEAGGPEPVAPTGRTSLPAAAPVPRRAAPAALPPSAGPPVVVPALPALVPGTPRAAPAPPPQQQGAGAEPPASGRLGYPEALQNADLARLLALALPGLAAIAGMTALGGFLGYRQAKAGYVLRTAGAGRFLQ